MRLIRIFIATAIITLVPVLTASAAHAAIAGPCTAGGRVTVDAVPKTPIIDPATTNSAKIPEKGVVHWTGTAGSGNRTISGHIDIALPPPIGKVQIKSWGGKSGKHANAGTYKYDFPSELLGLKIPVSGAHTERGISCSGSITVQLDGSPIKNPALIASLVLTFLLILNMGLVLRAKP